LASIVDFRVWDGYCPSGGIELAPCPEAVVRLEPTSDGIYHPLSQAQGLTIDTIISNPRVRDRYVQIDIRFSWESPAVFSGTGRIPEFDTVNGSKSQLAERFVWFTTRANSILPNEGVMSFRLIETGQDIPEQSQLVEMHFRFRQPSPPT
jgi:hypothetical protein